MEDRHIDDTHIEELSDKTSFDIQTEGLYLILDEYANRYIKEIDYENKIITFHALSLKYKHRIDFIALCSIIDKLIKDGYKIIVDSIHIKDKNDYDKFYFVELHFPCNDDESLLSELSIFDILDQIHNFECIRFNTEPEISLDIEINNHKYHHYIINISAGDRILTIKTKLREVLNWHDNKIIIKYRNKIINDIEDIDI